MSIILKEWDKEKSRFLQDLLDDKLIVSRPYNYKMSSTGIKQVFEKLKNENPRPYNTIKTLFYGLIARNVLDMDLLLELISDDTLINNKYDGVNKIINFPDNSYMKISKGMKPMRIIGKICEKYLPQSMEQFEEFRNWHSLLFNQSNMEGEICLSIHPLDFMTMSDNDCDWDSCMSWQKPGDHCAGTLECLNSPYILIAYLHNPNHTMEFGSKLSYRRYTEKWNSKRWRNLYIINDGVITSIKDYPYQDEQLTKTCLEWIRELAKKNLGWEIDEEYNFGSVVNISETESYGVIADPTYYMYGDFGTLKEHPARINFSKLLKESSSGLRNGFYCVDTLGYHIHHNITIPYGGKATCMCCGDYIRHDEDRDSLLLCYDCAPGHNCSICGEFADIDECYEVDDCFICECCFENETLIDSLTNEYHIDTIDLKRIKWLLGRNENNELVYYDVPLYVYDPENNNEYKRVFNCQPLEYVTTRPYGGFPDHGLYITLDMVKDIETFADAFGFTSDDIPDILDDYQVVKEEPCDIPD